MKTTKYALLVLLLGFASQSCTKEDICTTCTEATTSVSSDFCGSESEVEFFETELIESGGNLGQDWSCQRN